MVCHLSRPVEHHSSVRRLRLFAAERRPPSNQELDFAHGVVLRELELPAVRSLSHKPLLQADRVPNHVRIRLHAGLVFER